MTALIDGLHANRPSGDAWALALLSAAGEAETALRLDRARLVHLLRGAFAFLEAAAGRPCSVSFRADDARPLPARPEDLALTTAAVVLFARGAARNVLSPDAWSLARHRAVRVAEAAGVSGPEFDEALGNASGRLEGIRRANPMSSMF